MYTNYNFNTIKPRHNECIQIITLILLNQDIMNVYKL